MSNALKKLDDSGTKIMSIMLHHQYTHESIQNNGLNALKSIDNDRYSLIKNASEMLPFEDQYNFYIARSKLVTVTADFGTNEDDSDNDFFGMSEGMPRANAIKKWRDQDGEPVDILDKYIEPDDFIELVLNPDCKGMTADLDSRRYYGQSIKKKKDKYVGNEGI